VKNYEWGEDEFDKLGATANVNNYQYDYNTILEFLNLAYLSDKDTEIDHKKEGEILKKTKICHFGAMNHTPPKAQIPFIILWKILIILTIKTQRIWLYMNKKMNKSSMMLVCTKNDLRYLIKVRSVID
jgi:phosphorylcholine metabolism protein LicD